MNSNTYYIVEEYKKELFKWTHSCGYEELYANTSSQNVQRTAKDINTAIEGKDRLLFIIESKKGNVFGCYCGVRVDQNTTCVWDDPNHFVFTLENNVGIKPKRYKRRVNGILPSLCLWSNDNQDNVFCVPGLCWITNPIKPSFVYRNFSNVYCDDGEGYGVFCENEMQIEKKANASFVSVNTVIVCRMKPIGKSFNVKLQQRMGKTALDELFSQYGKCHVEVKGTGTFARLNFENTEDAARCYQDKSILQEKYGCSLEPK